MMYELDFLLLSIIIINHYCYDTNCWNTQHFNDVFPYIYFDATYSINVVNLNESESGKKYVIFHEMKIFCRNEFDAP